MAKKTIITCDVTGAEGAETITLPIWKRNPDPAGKVEYRPVDFEVDLTHEAQRLLIRYLVGYLPQNTCVQDIKVFFESHAESRIAKPIIHRLESI